MLTPLLATPVLGVAMDNVSLLRLDLEGGPAPGNKRFKLQGYLRAAREQGLNRLLSFGGVWSNHLHALAASGHAEGMATVGIVRGSNPGPGTAMLADAGRYGMRLHHVSRAEYGYRSDPHYLRQLQQRFGPCLVIPEGGAGATGVAGSRIIGERLRTSAVAARRAVLAVGTGTTLAGVALGLGPEWRVVGVSALKGANDLPDRVASALAAARPDSLAHWEILQEFHCGGFARVSAALREFMLAFERVQGVPLEPVYTGKVLFAIHQLLQTGAWSSCEPIVAIHTGGLQGRRGYPWLAEGARSPAMI